MLVQHTKAVIKYNIKMSPTVLKAQYFIQVSEEMVALLAFIGFYIFGICCYKVCTGFLESSSNETKKPNTNAGKFRIKTEIVNDKMDYLAV